MLPQPGHKDNQLRAALGSPGSPSDFAIDPPGSQIETHATAL
jgi:hypothetical protein